MLRVLGSSPAEHFKLVLEELEPRIAPTVLVGAPAHDHQTHLSAHGQSGAEQAPAPATNDPLEGYVSGDLTGPVAGSASALGLAPPGPDAVILPGLPGSVPDYDWWYGCVPTSAGMLLAWWDQTFNSNIFPGDPNDWVYNVYPSNNPADFTHANGVVAGWNHAQVDSYTGHVPDSLADFLLTAQGGTYPVDIPHGLEAYAAWDDPRTAANDSFLATATLRDSMSGWSYAEYCSEIDAGRPVMLGLTSLLGGHAVLGVGYDNTDGVPHMVILDTWHDGLQEWGWTNEGESGFNFSVDSGITFDVLSQPVPDLSGYLAIAHTSISDLTVRVGLGDPENPTWVETVWNGGGGYDDNLVLTNVDLSGALPYLDQNQNWFIDVYDGAALDTGHIQDFQVWYGGHDGQRWFTGDGGGAISDFNHTYAHLTTSVPLLPVTLDPTSDTGISSSDGLTRNTMPLVNVTVPSAGTIWVDFNNDGTWDASVAAAAPGTYSVQSPLSLTDGAHVISAKLTDLGGSSEYGRLHLTIDTHPPAAPTTAPDLDAASDTGRYQVDNITADATPTFHVSGFGSYYQVLRDGVRVSAEYATDSTFTEPLPVPGGVHNYAVSSVDDAGNLSAPSSVLRVTVDTTPPVLSAMAPAEGSSVHSILTQGSLTFGERMNDSLLAANVLLEASGGDGHFGDGNEHFVPLTLQYEVGSSSATFQVASPLPSDLYRLHVNPGLEDLAGNPFDGNHDGSGGDAYLGDFRVEASYTWHQGAATVTVYDLVGAVDFRPEDFQVRFGRGDAVSSIRLGGSHSMDGVGIIIHGATSGGSITDARSGAIGNLAFIVSDSSLSGLSLKGGVAGYNLNGMTLGGITFPTDIDGDLRVDDLTSIMVTGNLGTTKLTGVVAGDVVVHGAVSGLQTTMGFPGDLVITGDAKALTIGGDLGHAGGHVSVGGVLGNLTVASKLGPANLVGDLTVVGAGGNIVVGSKTTGGALLGDIQVGGLLKGLTVAGALTGDVVVHGDLTSAVVGGDLGVAGGSFQVDGVLKSLTVGSSTAAGHVLSDLVAGKDLTKAVIYGDVRGEVHVGGNLGSLTVASKLGPANLVGDLTVVGAGGNIVVGSKATGGALLGDIQVGGLLKGLTVAGALTGDVVVHGDLTSAVVGGDLGVAGGNFQVDGVLKSLTVGSSTATGHVLSDLVAGKDLTKAVIYGDVRGEVHVGGNLGSLTARHVTSGITVVGNLSSLTTTSTLVAGAPPVDYVFQNPDPEADGQLLVTGSIGKVTHV